LALAVLRPFHRYLLASICQKALLLNSLLFGEAYDSVLKIEEGFRSPEVDPPPLLSSALFKNRYVFSILSVENNSAYDIRDLRLRLFKRHSFVRNDTLHLRAWTISESLIECEDRIGKEISIHIPRLRAHSDVILIVSNWQSQLKAEDIVLSCEKLKSINENRIWGILSLTFLFAAGCRFTIGYLNRNSSKQS
jgi:hypothetical protein